LDLLSGLEKIAITAVKSGSAAAKAGLVAGMHLVSVNGVGTKNVDSDTIRIVLREAAVPISLKFEFQVPATKTPGIYHVRHESMVVAAAVVGHIESFLGYAHAYEDNRIAETNVVLASLLRCNTNVQPVGSLSAAMSVLQYLSGYLSKNPIELCNFVSCIIAARRRCKTSKSTAEDAGTCDRNAKFLAQKVRSIDII